MPTTRSMPPRRTARTTLPSTIRRRRSCLTRSVPARPCANSRKGVLTSGPHWTRMMISRLLAAVLAALILIAPAAATDAELAKLARASGTPDIPGLKMVWLAPWGDVGNAKSWRNIIVHQTEGPAGSGRGGAQEQAKNPTRRGVTLWVETDGTVYWAAPENLVPTHGDGANRNDNKYIDNASTFRQVVGNNSIGVEFSGNYPDVTRGATEAQIAAWRILLKVLRARYAIPLDRVYAHNWIDYKDARYCEGCALATMAREWGD